MDPRIKKLFEGYEKFFSALDVEKQSRYFADNFISAGPKGTIAMSKQQFTQMATQMAEQYRKLGQTGAKILSMKEMPVSEHYTMVKTHWGATFQKTGDKLMEFDVSYLLQMTGPEPKIILFIAHQDEEQTMKELGLR
jgi:hypothetical protein